MSQNGQIHFKGLVVQFHMYVYVMIVKIVYGVPIENLNVRTFNSKQICSFDQYSRYRGVTIWRKLT